MSEIHFRSHFHPFQMDNITLIFLTKCMTTAILDVRISLSIAFLANFRSIRNINCFEILTKWLTSAILDVRNSLSIAFLAISDRYATFFFLEIFDKMAAVGHFGCPKFTFDRISGHFRSIGHFGMHVSSFNNVIQILQKLSRITEISPVLAIYAWPHSYETLAYKSINVLFIESC